MSSLSDLKNEARDKLKQIATSFIEPIYQNNLAFRGTAESTNVFTDRPGGTTPDKKSLSYFVPVLFSGYTSTGTGSGFIEQYPAANNISSSKVGLVDTVLVRNMTDSSSKAYQILNLDITKMKFADYNTSPKLTSNTEISLRDYITTNSELGCNMDNIRMLYSLLDDTNYKNYVYLLNNPGMQSAPTINLVRYFSDTIVSVNSVTNEAFIRMKNLIENLKGISVLSTNTLINLTATDKPNMNLSNVTINDTFRPKETKGDALALLNPQTSTNDSYVGDLTVDPKIIAGTSVTTRYYTVSFYARMRNDSGDANSTQLKSVFLMDNHPENANNIPSLRNSIPYFTEFNDGITSNWTRITHTVKYDLPASSIGQLKFRLYIDHQKATNAPQQYVYITGLQSSVSTEQPNGDDPFRLPQFDDTRTSRLVIRRLLLLYELMATYYVAAYIKTQNMPAITTDATSGVKSSGTDSADNHKRATSLMNLVYEYMTNYNRNILRDSDSADSANILSKLSGNVAKQFSTYASSTSTLTTLGSTMKENQYTLKSNISSMNAQKKMDAKTKLYKYIALVIFIIILITCVVVYILPLEGKQKIMAAGAIGGIGVVTMMIFMFIYSTNVEQFQASNLLKTPGNYAGGIGISTFVDFTSDVSIVAISFANDYLANTIQIALMVQTYVGYGNINFALQKDISRYTDINTQLSTSSYKINSATNAYSMNKYSNRALISFLVTVALLIAITVAVVVATQNYPGVRMWILMVAGFVLFLAILFYMLDTSARVRTAATKKYWGTPNTSSL